MKKLSIILLFALFLFSGCTTSDPTQPIETNKTNQTKELKKSDFNEGIAWFTGIPTKISHYKNVKLFWIVDGSFSNNYSDFVLKREIRRATSIYNSPTGNYSVVDTIKYNNKKLLYTFNDTIRNHNGGLLYVYYVLEYYYYGIKYQTEPMQTISLILVPIY